MTVNEQDILLLSAYIDGELTDNERVHLEARLQSEADLQEELDTLQQTVALVRQMPTLKAPRDYTLDPARFGTRQRNVVAFRMRALTYAAAAVIVAVFGLVLLVSTGGSQEDGARSAERDVAEQTQPPQSAASTSVAQAQQPQSTSEVAIAPTSTASPNPTDTPTATPLPTMAGQGGAFEPESPPEPQQEESDADVARDGQQAAQGNVPAEEASEISGGIAASDTEAEGEVGQVVADTPLAAPTATSFNQGLPGPQIDDTTLDQSATGTAAAMMALSDEFYRDDEGLQEAPEDNEFAANIQTEREPGAAAGEGVLGSGQPPSDALNQAAPEPPAAGFDAADGREERLTLVLNSLLMRLRDLFAALLNALP